MRYVVTIVDDKSPDLGASSWHCEHGTGTIECEDIQDARFEAEGYLRRHKTVVIIRIKRMSWDDTMGGWTVLDRENGYYGTYNLPELGL